MKKEFIATLNNASKLIEYIIQDNYVEDCVNDKEFSDLVKNVSYYKIDEIVDYLETLIEMEEK